MIPNSSTTYRRSSLNELVSEADQFLKPTKTRVDNSEDVMDTARKKTKLASDKHFKQMKEKLLEKKSKKNSEPNSKSESTHGIQSLINAYEDLVEESSESDELSISPELVIDRTKGKMSINSLCMDEEESSENDELSISDDALPAKPKKRKASTEKTKTINTLDKVKEQKTSKKIKLSKPKSSANNLLDNEESEEKIKKPKHESSIFKSEFDLTMRITKDIFDSNKNLTGTISGIADNGTFLHIAKLTQLDGTVAHVIFKNGEYSKIRIIKDRGNSVPNSKWIDYKTLLDAYNTKKLNK